MTDNLSEHERARTILALNELLREERDYPESMECGHGWALLNAIRALEAEKGADALS